jgi:hypothetical protein
MMESSVRKLYNIPINALVGGKMLTSRKYSLRTIFHEIFFDTPGCFRLGLH